MLPIRAAPHSHHSCPLLIESEASIFQEIRTTKDIPPKPAFAISVHIHSTGDSRLTTLIWQSWGIFPWLQPDPWNSSWMGSFPRQPARALWGWQEKGTSRAADLPLQCCALWAPGWRVRAGECGLSFSRGLSGYKDQEPNPLWALPHQLSHSKEPRLGSSGHRSHIAMAAQNHKARGQSLLLVLCKHRLGFLICMVSGWTRTVAFKLVTHENHQKCMLRRQFPGPPSVPTLRCWPGRNGTQRSQCQRTTPVILTHVVRGHTSTGTGLGVSALKFYELRLLVCAHLALETGLLCGVGSGGWKVPFPALVTGSSLLWDKFL